MNKMLGGSTRIALFLAVTFCVSQLIVAAPTPAKTPATPPATTAAATPKTTPSPACHCQTPVALGASQGTQDELEKYMPIALEVTFGPCPSNDTITLAHINNVSFLLDEYMKARQQADAECACCKMTDDERKAINKDRADIIGGANGISPINQLGSHQIAWLLPQKLTPCDVYRNNSPTVADIRQAMKFLLIHVKESQDNFEKCLKLHTKPAEE